MRKYLILPLLILSLLVSCVGVPPTDAGNAALSFVDDLGRTVTLSDTPKRTACLLGSFSDIWLLSGGTVCASASDAWETLSLDLGDAHNLGGAHSPSLEILLSANPDFVLASASTGSHLAMREVLEEMAIPVAYFDIDSFEDYLSMLKICTDLTGHPELYISNGLALQEGIERLKAEYSKQEFTNERKILLLRTSSTGVKVKGSEGTVLGEMLADFGTVNIATSNESLLESLSLEAIAEGDPYHIFVVTMGSDTDLALEVFHRLIEENPLWASLSAVKAGRVHFMDKTLFNLKPNARYLEAYEILYEALITK